MCGGFSEESSGVRLTKDGPNVIRYRKEGKEIWNPNNEGTGGGSSGDNMKSIIPMMPGAQVATSDRIQASSQMHTSTQCRQTDNTLDRHIQPVNSEQHSDIDISRQEERRGGERRLMLKKSNGRESRGAKRKTADQRKRVLEEQQRRDQEELARALEEQKRKTADQRKRVLEEQQRRDQEELARALEEQKRKTADQKEKVLEEQQRRDQEELRQNLALQKHNAKKAPRGDSQIDPSTATKNVTGAQGTPSVGNSTRPYPSVTPAVSTKVPNLMDAYNDVMRKVDF